MKSKKLGLFLTLALVLTGALAFAQDAPKEEEAPIKISGLNYFAFNMAAGSISKDASANSLGQYYFSLDRLYLNWDHKLGKNLKYHVTLDSGTMVTAVTATTATSVSGTSSYVPYIHTAYATAMFGMDDVFGVNIDFGIVGTKIIANRNKMMDLRWITSKSFDGHAYNIGTYLAANTNNAFGVSVNNTMSDGDQSADLGFSLDIELLKMITLNFAVVAGEGRKNVLTDQQPKNGGKAIYVDLFIEPIKGIYATGYFRHETTQFLNAYDTTYSGTYQWFAGAGVGINLMGIRVGADFETGQNVTTYNIAEYTNAKNFFVLNAWVNWNLQEIAGFPLLVIGKMVYGTYSDTRNFRRGTGPTSAFAWYNEGGMQYDSVNWMAGLGWQFNKNFRLAIIFEQTIFSDTAIYMANGGNPYDTAAMTLAKSPTTGVGGWNNANSMLYVKTETKF